MTDWKALETRVPGVMALAVDGAGMVVAFDGACDYNGPGRCWVPVGGCTKHTLFLSQYGGTPGFEPGSTLEIRPGYEEEFRTRLEGRQPVRSTPLPKEASAPGDRQAKGAELGEAVDERGVATQGDLSELSVAVDPRQAPSAPAPSPQPVQLDLRGQLGLAEPAPSPVPAPPEAVDSEVSVPCQVNKHQLTTAIKLLYQALPKTRQAQIREHLTALVGDLEDA